MWEWKTRSNGSTALLIEGARRIGKSYIVEKFAQQEYKSHILVDFNDMSSDLLSIFEQFLHDRDELFIRLSLFYGVRRYDRASVMIFDDIGSLFLAMI